MHGLTTQAYWRDLFNSTNPLPFQNERFLYHKFLLSLMQYDTLVHNHTFIVEICFFSNSHNFFTWTIKVVLKTPIYSESKVL